MANKTSIKSTKVAKKAAASQVAAKAAKPPYALIAMCEPPNICPHICVVYACERLGNHSQPC